MARASANRRGFAWDAFGSMVAGLAPVIGEMIRHTADVIQADAYGNPESSVRICARGFELFVRQAREARINAEFPTFGLGLFGRAVAAGFGDEEAAAVIKVLRAGSGGTGARGG